MTESIAPANGIEICYETLGDPHDPALLLVMGFTAQLTAWDPALCQMLVDRGRHVIRFDNRDVGRSTHLDGVAVDLPAVMAASAGSGTMPLVPYQLSDFAADGFALLDHLGIERAHVLGASMGGMIAQTMAVDRPERLLSLTSVMSSTNEAEYGQAAPEVMAALLTPPPTERDAFVNFAVSRAKMFSSPRYFDPDRSARFAGDAFDRAFYPEGAARQLSAIMASPSRVDRLRSLSLPTLVIHGRADTLISPSGGERTAELIPGANLLLMHDMGHDLPQQLWPLIVDAVVSHTSHRIG